MDMAPFITLKGDRDRAITLRRFALTQLEITRGLMKYRNLEQYKRRVTLHDGTVITCKVQFGLPLVTIYVPPRGKILNEQELDYTLLSIIPFSHVGSETADMEAHFIRVRNFKKGPPTVSRKLIGDEYWDINDYTPFYDDVYSHWGPATPCLLVARSFTWNKTGNDASGTTLFMCRSDYHQVCDEIMDIQEDDTDQYLDRAMINGAAGIACGWAIDRTSLDQRIFYLTARLINPPAGWGSNWVQLKLF